MPRRHESTEVVIAGGGLAGIVAAHELLDRGKSVILLEKDQEANLGGLAKISFGGVMMVGTPHQRRLGIQDSPDLAYRDWESFAFFGAGDEWPKRWARRYCDQSLDLVFRFLDSKGVKFLPLINWPERGLFRPGNSVPRWHITWGTGHEIISCLLSALQKHARRDRLVIRFDEEVCGIATEGERVTGVYARNLKTGERTQVSAEHTIIASGGICGGDLTSVRANWYPAWGAPPKHLLNGSHPYADGLLHREVGKVGGRVTHLDKQWHYPSGVHHPAHARANDGLSLVPPRSALWLNARGERIGPLPLVGYSDTRYLVETILKQPGQYSWQLLNWKIAIKELAVSGSEYMTAFRHKKKLLMLKHLLFGNRELVHRLIRECPEDFVVGKSLGEIVDKMNKRSLEGQTVDRASVEKAVREYDHQIDRGQNYFTDDQLRRIQNHRAYRADRIRVCKFQKIGDASALPLIAIREFILSRKSLGGIQTDLSCRVLNENGKPISGLYAVGEAAGFGGGGIHGLGSLEGTFLGACILTGREAGRAIA